jgi:hypothetical protein
MVYVGPPNEPMLFRNCSNLHNTVLRSRADGYILTLASDVWEVNIHCVSSSLETLLTTETWLPRPPKGDRPTLHIGNINNWHFVSI